MYFCIILEKRRVLTMLLFEIKKVLSKPLNKAALAILAAVLVIGSILTIRDVNYIDADGNSSAGISAARNLREEKNQYEGYLTEDVIRQVIRENAAVSASPEAQSEDAQENNKAAAEAQGFADIREMINLAFGEMENYDYYRINSVSEDEAGSFYEQRIAGLKDYLNSDNVTDSFTEEEKEWLINKYESLDTPLYYEYADGWKALMDSQYLPTLMMITVLITGFLVSGIFSDEFAWKADSIFFSARLGRGKAILSKMGAGFLITTVLYWSTVFLFGFIVLAVLGFGGGNCAVQTGVSNWNSIYNITYFQDYLLSTAGGYVGSLFITTLAMLVSAKTRSTVFAITVPFILTCVPPFVGRLEAFARIMTLFPDQLLSINKNLEDFSLYHIGGGIFGGVTVIIPLYLILFCLVFPVLFLVYRRTQIR